MTSQGRPLTEFRNRFPMSGDIHVANIALLNEFLGFVIQSAVDEAGCLELEGFDHRAFILPVKL